jgi:hypothetical protein
MTRSELDDWNPTLNFSFFRSADILDPKTIQPERRVVWDVLSGRQKFALKDGWVFLAERGYVDSSITLHYDFPHDE